jgi:hypothetical protein
MTCRDVWRAGYVHAMGRFCELIGWVRAVGGFPHTDGKFRELLDCYCRLRALGTSELIYIGRSGNLSLDAANENVSNGKCFTLRKLLSLNEMEAGVAARHPTKQGSGRDTVSPRGVIQNQRRVPDGLRSFERQSRVPSQFGWGHI